MVADSIQYYLVGGAVRDLLWGRLPTECDYAFSGSAEDFVQANPSACKVGRRDVQVFIMDGQEFMPLHGGTPESDLHRRDLTVNALALDENGLLYAHPMALADLEQRILRAASPHAFADDPARVFRLARFAALYPGCVVDPATLEQARSVAVTEAFRALPAERVGRELLKALNGPEPGRCITVLHEAGALEHWFAELAGADGIPAGPPQYHTHHVLGHLIEVMNRCAGDAMAAWMGLCHDLGKVLTDPEILPHHYGHEATGMDAAERLAERLAMPNLHKKAGILASKLHMKAGKYETLRIGTRVDLLLEVHQARLHEPFWRLVRADSGRDLRPVVDRDLALLLAVRLPEHYRNKGEKSGVYLRELRCRALAESRNTRGTVTD